MNQSSPISTSAPETVDTGSVDQPTQPTQFVSPARFKQIKAQQKHLQNLIKKRDERWKQPYADAKMEDIKFLIDKILEYRYEIEMLRKVLKVKGLVLQEDVDAILKRDEERFNKANELKADTVLSNEEKIAIANEYEIPLEVLGLQTPPQGDAERDISEPVK